MRKFKCIKTANWIIRGKIYRLYHQPEMNRYIISRYDISDDIAIGISESKMLEYFTDVFKYGK